MAWFPAGPAFVFAPRNANFRRLSRRNEKGRQSVVRDIAVDPTYAAAANTQPAIYIVEGRARESTNAWRSDDGGATWTSIADTLRRQMNNVYIDPSCIAINPVNPGTIYLGTSSWYFYWSSDRGATWSQSTAISSETRRILVDARTAANPATTVLYAATATGLRRSATGGATWDPAPIINGDVRALAGHFDAAAGTARVYAAVFSGGTLRIYYTTNPAAFVNWIELSSAGIGLPTAIAGGFDAIVIDVCVRNPNRAYVWLSRADSTVGIYTTAAPATSWTRVNAVTPPNPWQGINTFAVAPNSPGDGLNDILVFGTIGIHRSIDAGRTWVEDPVLLHVDHRSLAFAPVNPAPGVTPVTYAGTDGGLARSTQFANPNEDIEIVGNYSETMGTPRDTHVWQNCNRGRSSVHCLGYAVVPEQPALSYLASWDSGIKAGDTSRTWRGISDFDSNAVAALAAPDGVAVWAALYVGGQINRWRDNGEFLPVKDTPTLNGQPFTAWLLTPGFDYVCYFTIGNAVGRVGPLGSAATGTAALVSTPFPGTVRAIAIHPTDRNVVYCLTRDAAGTTRAWMNTHAPTSDLGTVWTEIAAGRPTGQALCLAVGAGGVAYVGMGYLAGGVALYALTGGAWIAQQTAGAPSGGGISLLAADPTDSNVLYAWVGEAVVYRLTLSGGTWLWQVFSSVGLPEMIKTIKAFAVGPSTARQTILRVSTPTRGIFESRADPTAADPTIDLYVRDNFLDTAWATGSPDGVVNPLKPARRVWHWECADIKIDPEQQARPPGQPLRRWFQSDPEWDTASPLDPVLFDELRELALVAGRPAWVHVQVHNRSWTSTQGVSVWTLYADASTGLPMLDETASGARFPFWNQFTAAGAIVPALPADSLWKAVGPPRVLSGLDAEHPRVASWLWTVPSAASQPPHHCLATFIHSAAAGIGETTRYDVDAIAPSNRQVGLKNVVVVPPPPLRKRPFRIGPKHVHFNVAMSASLPRGVPIRIEIDFADAAPVLDMQVQMTVDAREVAGAKRAGMLRELLAYVANRVAGWLSPRSGRARLTRAMYVVDGKQRVEFSGMETGRGREMIRLSVGAVNALESGRDYRFTLIQHQGGEVRGGVTYVIRGEAGDRPSEPETEADLTETAEAIVVPPDERGRQARSAESKG